MLIRPRHALCLLAVCTTILSLVGPATGQSDEESDPVLLKLHSKVTRFLEGVIGEDQQRAFDELLAGSQLSKKSPAYQGLLKQSQEIEAKYGKFRESDRITAKRIGKDLVLLKYLFKCEHFPVVWYIAYYRDLSRQPATTAEDENWVVISVRFDTQLEQLAQ